MDADQTDRLLKQACVIDREGPSTRDHSSLPIWVIPTQEGNYDGNDVANHTAAVLTVLKPKWTD